MLSTGSEAYNSSEYDIYAGSMGLGIPADLIDIAVQAAGLRLKEPLQRSQEGEVMRPGQGTVRGSVGDGMASKPGLGIGLRRHGTGEKVGDRTLPNACAAHDHDNGRCDGGDDRAGHPGRVPAAVPTE